MHAVAFCVLDVNGNEPKEYKRGRIPCLSPRGATVRVVVEFANHTDTPYPLMYHCHLLKHEDDRMMGQFLLVEPNLV
ncbi:multicopper oxidase domain-containing protein [Virgibacillus oceani]